MNVNAPETDPLAPPLPCGWAWTTFEETCEPVSDGGRKIPQKAYLKSGKYPVVDQGESVIGGYTDDPALLYQGNTPVIVFGDHTRRFKLIDWPFVVGADGVRLIAPSGAWDSKCLWLFFQALAFEDRGYSRHFQFVRKASLPLPPLNEQRRIADRFEEVVSDLDAAVAALERAQRKFALYRAAVLKAAVEGRLVPTNAEYQWQPISAVIESLDQGWSPKCERDASDDPQDWAVIKTTSIQPLRFLEGQNKRLPKALTPRPHLQVAAGDLLMTRAGPRSRAGVACAVKNVRPRLMLCDKAYRLRCKPQLAIPTFLEVVLNAPQIVDVLDTLKTGINDSGVNLTQARFLELRVPLPRLSEQEAIVEAVEDQLSVIDHIEADLETKLKTAQALRQSILRDAFTGRLVPQDPNDEPASELLKRIAAEREERARQAAAAKREGSNPRASRRGRSKTHRYGAQKRGSYSG
jgi:type I restriction enzyme S subunit